MRKSIANRKWMIATLTIGLLFVSSNTEAAYITNGNSQWQDNGSSMIYYNAGKVGIGTSEPTSKLQINGAASTEGLRIITSNYSPFVIRNAADTSDLFRIDQNGNITSLGALQGSNTYWNLNGSDLYASSTAWNVGIGTTDPSSILHVYGGASTSRITLGRAGAPGMVGFMEYPAGVMQIGTAGSDGLNLQTTNATRLSIGASGGITIANGNNFVVNTNTLFVNSASSTVGIGTTVPGKLLDLQKSAATADVGLRIANTASTVGDTASIYFQMSSTMTSDFGPRIVATRQGSNAMSDLAFWTTNSGGVSSERMRLLNNGSISIGTTTSLASLGVVGGNVVINDAVITAGTPKAAITKEYLESALLNKLTAQRNTSAIDINALGDTFLLYGGSTANWLNRGPSGHNGGGILHIPTHPGDYYSDLWFDTGGGRIYSRVVNAGTIGAWSLLPKVNTSTANYLSKWSTFDSIGNSQVYDNGTNIGIGTTAPGAKLHVNGTSIFNDVATFTQPVIVGAPVNAGHAATKNYVDSTIANATSSITLWGGTLVGNIWNLNSGNVGIGTTSPGYNLDIASSSNAHLRISGGNTGYTNADVILQANSDTDYRGLGTFLYQTTSQKEWFIGSPYADADSIIIARQTGLAAHNANTAQNASALLKITSSGNVGIGTTTPSKKLDVNGDVTISNSGSLYFKNTSGADTLSMNFSGNLFQVGSAYDAVYKGGSHRIYLTGTGPKMYIQNSGGTATYVTVDGSGNVGISTSTPGIRLTVAGFGNYSIDATNYRIGNVATPVTNLDAVNKSYVDSTILWSGTKNGNIWNGDSGAGNVGIGITNPDAKLSVNGTFSQVVSSGIRKYYNVASYDNSTNAATGTIIATLPKYGASTMLSIKISGYDYTDGRGYWEVLIGGYDYNDHNWYSKNVVFKGTPPFTQVRLANDGVRDLILLGATSTVWSYPKVVINEVATGHTNTDNWGNGWSMSLTTSEPTLYNVSTLTPKVFENVSGSIGIGTTAPDAKLNVNGTFHVTGALNSVVMDRLSGTGNRIVMTDATGSLYATSSAIASGLPSAAGNSGATLRSDGSNWIANTNLYNNGTNVAIGTTSPGTYKLNVNGSMYSNSLYVSTPGGSWITGKTGNVGLNGSIPQTGGAYHPMLRQITSSGHVVNLGGLGDSFGFYGYDVNRVINGTDYSFAMNLANGTMTASHNMVVSGNLGVGTTPGARLTVANIGASSTPITLAQLFNNIPYAAGNGVGAARLEIGHGSLHGYIEAGSISESDSSSGYMAFGTRRPTNNIAEAMRINNAGNVGIGVTAPARALQVGAITLGGSADASANVLASGGVIVGAGTYVSFDPSYAVHSRIRYNTSGTSEAKMEFGGYYGFNFIRRDTTSAMVIKGDTGYVAIGTTTATSTLTVSGGNVTILDSSITSGTPKAAVTKDYLDSALSALGSTDNYWKFTSPDKLYASSTDWKVGIGTTNPGTTLTLGNNKWISAVDGAGTGYANMFRVNAANQIEIGSPLLIGPLELTQDGGALTFIDMPVTAAAAAGTVESYTMKIDGNNLLSLYSTSNGTGGVNNLRVGIGTTNPSSSLHVVGNATISTGLTMGGDINLGGNNITNINKLTVNTIDPLYRIKGTNYSTYASAIVGGVNEEYVGRVKISRLAGAEYEAVIRLDALKEGSDLWVWRKVVDFSPENVQALITPYGSFARVYYKIDGESLIFRSDRPAEISYRLIGKRHDWRQWPTRSNDQKEKPGFILD